MSALSVITEWLGLVENGQDLAPYREQIASLYLQVCGKLLRKCKCRDILKDAVIEIYGQLKRKDMEIEKSSTARLVAGVLLQLNGQHYSNTNLTDDVAREFLAKFPQKKAWFAVLPPAEEKAGGEQVAEMPENGAEIAPKAVKPASQTTTPKKRKSPKKRK